MIGSSLDINNSEKHDSFPYTLRTNSKMIVAIDGSGSMRFG